MSMDDLPDLARVPLLLISCGTPGDMEIVPVREVSFWYLGLDDWVDVNLPQATYIAELVERNKRFGLHYVSKDMQADAAYCHLNSGTQTDKSRLTGLLVQMSDLEIPLIQAAPYSVECAVQEAFSFGGGLFARAGVMREHMRQAPEHLLYTDGINWYDGFPGPILSLADARFKPAK